MIVDKPSLIHRRSVVSPKALPLDWDLFGPGAIALLPALPTSLIPRTSWYQWGNAAKLLGRRLNPLVPRTQVFTQPSRTDQRTPQAPSWKTVGWPVNV